MSKKISVRDLDLRGQRVLIRVDFNVPIDKGEISHDARIRASIPTIEYVINQGGAVILLSHLGRPKGKVTAEFSLTPCAKRLADLIKRPVIMAPDCQGEETAEMARRLKPGEVLLLENLRFHPGEEKPEQEPAFVSGLASLGDLYVNDAFSSAHRSHASTTAIAQFFPRKAAMGLLLEKEIAHLEPTLLNPKRPFYAILGGSKVSSKFKVIETLMHKADALLIGGAMAFTFLKAESIPVGDSLVEDSFLGVAREILDVSSQSRSRILLPTDFVVTREVKSGAESLIVDVKDGIPPGFTGVDIGPATIKRYVEEIKKGATFFWNGPMGVFECPPFDQGTNSIANAIAEVSGEATTIVGGGDSIAALEQNGCSDKVTHVSTGGGATLEYIEFGQLPGIQSLSDKNED